MMASDECFPYCQAPNYSQNWIYPKHTRRERKSLPVDRMWRRKKWIGNSIRNSSQQLPLAMSFPTENIINLNTHKSTKVVNSTFVCMNKIKQKKIPNWESLSTWWNMKLAQAIYIHNYKLAFHPSKNWTAPIFFIIRRPPFFSLW